MEQIWAKDGGDGAGHRGQRVADEDTFLNVEFLQNREQIVGVALESGVAVEIEVVGIGGAGAHVVVEYDSVLIDEVWDQLLPHRLIGAEAVAEDDGGLAGADDSYVVSCFNYAHFIFSLLIC